MSNALFNNPLNVSFSLAQVADSANKRALETLRRLSVGMRPGEIAEKLNVSPQVVTNWFRRESIPSSAHDSVAEAYEISVDELIGKGKPGSVHVLPQRSPAAARFAAEWDKIEDPIIRDHIRAMVEAVVTRQMKIKAGKRQPEGDRPRGT